MEYDEKDLITYICKKIAGVGEKTATAISVYIDNLSNLFDNIDKLDNLQKVSGKKVLDARQIIELKQILKEYFPERAVDIRKAWISVLIRDFVKNSIKEIQETTLDTLVIKVIREIAIVVVYFRIVFYSMLFKNSALVIFC